MIAVDANGADQGPAAVAEGVRRSGLPVAGLRPEARAGGGRRPGRAGRRAGDDQGRRRGPWPRCARARRRRSSKPRRRGSGRADALVSAGSTGPTLAAGTIEIKRIRGCLPPRAGRAAARAGRAVLLLDAGASVQARPEHLVQFAYMGACFMEACVGIERPRVGLLSVGEESGKGTPEVLAAHDGWPTARSTSSATSRASTSRARPSTSSWPTGSPATSRSRCSRAPCKSSPRDRERVRSGPVSSLGGLLIRGKLRGLRDELDPEARRRRDPAGPAQARRRRPRELRPARDRERGPAGAARRQRGDGRAHVGGARGSRGFAVRTRW